MGTSELTTGELTFNGAIAYPVGPLDRGVANVAGVVLSYSRLTVGISSAAFMCRAVREAKQYVQFRDAFGVKTGQFPMVQNQLNTIEKLAMQTVAGTFKLYKEFLSLEGGLQGGLGHDDDLDTRKKRFRIRELIMLQKITASWDSTDVIRIAMSLFGGHGVMEDFSSLPRLYRDSAVNELWEGPRNVLLVQMHRDLQRASEWYQPLEFIADLLQGTDPQTLHTLGREFVRLVSYPSLMQMSDETIAVCGQWDQFCHKLYHCYQSLALTEV
jgi:alkylation response protein AidB-like acyl-CoA dehydrogenase